MSEIFSVHRNDDGSCTLVLSAEDKTPPVRLRVRPSHFVKLLECLRLVSATLGEEETK